MARSRATFLAALAVVVVLACSGSARGAEAVEVDVSGTGWLQNRRLERSVERLRADPDAPVLTANGIEDAVFLLFSALSEDGYLQPRIQAELTRRDGTVFTHEFDPQLTRLLPRPLEVTRAKFSVERGVRFRFDDLQFDGDADGLTTEELHALLLPTGTALSVTVERDFSPAALRRGLGRIEDALRFRGFAVARAEEKSVTRDPETGDVDVVVAIDTGPRWWVASAEWSGDAPPGVQLPELAPRVDRPWNESWEQDVMEVARQAFFAQGFADVDLRSTRRLGDPSDGRRPVHVVFAFTPGERVTAAPVRFAGTHEVKESVLNRRVRVDPGEPLNPLEFEAARYRLSRLGAFRRVELRYEPEDGPVRAPVFTLTPLPEWEVHLLGGYGSYEQLRGGIEVRRNNVFHRAHQVRLELVQSFKSSSGELTYTVPELFGEAVDGSVQLFGLRREELAFVREEFGGTVSLRRRRLPWIHAEGIVSYTYQSLRNRENELTTRDIDTTDTIAASIDIGLNQDRRDNPLVPRQGYRWFAQAEIAAKALGGEVDYQRLELGFSYHRPWGRGRWLHAGFSHGVVLTLGADNDLLLPVNRRFYPGGDSSIRGYQLGEAAPRAPDGRFLGGKSTALLNLELEQAIVGKWTGVVFADVLGTAAELAEYPFDEYLVSVGLGFRYQTIIGPVRLEYGHNLRRRDGDPSGTLHFSLGFPF